jgi:MFS transporter, DHA2 family, multidrug resistance protein
LGNKGIENGAAFTQTWRPSFNPWLIAVSVMLATFMEVLDTSVATVALPHIAGSFSVTANESTWVLTSYLISNAVVLVSSGWLSNYFGRKRYQIASIALFASASALCGASTSLAMLVASRTLQGVAGGGLQPVSQAVLLETFPPARRGPAMAFYGMGIIVAPFIGPTFGGWITDNASWRWIFYINIPISIAAILMIQAFVEDPPYIKRVAGSRIDLLGFGFLAVWLGTMQTIFDKGQEADWFGAAWIRWFTLAAVLACVAFVIRELRTESPIVNLRILKDRNLAAGTLFIGLIGVVVYGTTALLPLFLQDLLGYSAFQSGIAVAPRAIGALLSMILAARLVNRVDGRILVTVGILIRAVSLLMLGNLNLQIGMMDVVWPNVINGFSNGLIFVPLTTMTMETLPNELMGGASSLYSLLRNMGSSFGISMVATMLARDAQTHQSIMVAHLTPYNFSYRQEIAHIKQLLAVRSGLGLGAPPEALIYRLLLRQASLWAYVDNFRLLAYLSLICLPFLLLFRTGTARRKRVMQDDHP